MEQNCASRGNVALFFQKLELDKSIAETKNLKFYNRRVGLVLQIQSW